MSVLAEQLRYSDGDVALDGVLVRDPDATPSPLGVLVVHGGAGLDDHALGRARRFAELGHVVLAADMYGPDVRGDRTRTMDLLAAFRADPDRIVRRAQAAVDALTSVPGCAGGVAAVGYCFGGMAVLELARAGSAVTGVVSVHGSLRAGVRAAAGAVRARILVCHGGSDPHVPQSDVDAFVAEMTAARADWQLTLYGGAQHGFTHDTDTGQTPGVAYDPVADARSGRDVQNFLADLALPGLAERTHTW